MYNSFALARKYLHYYLTAFNSKGHGMHSPFVFQFILHVLNNKSAYTPPGGIEEARKNFLNDASVLEIEDLGAGSRTAATKTRSVQQLAKSTLKPKKYAELLFRLVKYYQPQTILELGTSLGITTSYLAAANPAAAITTIEGSNAIAEMARKHFHQRGLKNVSLLQGNFDEMLPAVIKSLPTIDLAYIDGNHRYQPTINYFNQLLAAINDDSILVFDDIHWSAEMERAWEEIKKHPAVKCTVDVFFLGFVFFRPGFKVKQNFTIRF